MKGATVLLVKRKLAAMGGFLYAHAAKRPGFATPHWPAFTPPLTPINRGGKVMGWTGAPGDRQEVRGESPRR